MYFSTLCYKCLASLRPSTTKQQILMTAILQWRERERERESGGREKEGKGGREGGRIDTRNGTGRDGRGVRNGRDETEQRGWTGRDGMGQTGDDGTRWMNGKGRERTGLDGTIRDGQNGSDGRTH